MTPTSSSPKPLEGARNAVSLMRPGPWWCLVCLLSQGVWLGEETVLLSEERRSRVGLRVRKRAWRASRRDRQ